MIIDETFALTNLKRLIEVCKHVTLTHPFLALHPHLAHYAAPFPAYVLRVHTNPSPGTSKSVLCRRSKLAERHFHTCLPASHQMELLTAMMCRVEHKLNIPRTNAKPTCVPQICAASPTATTCFTLPPTLIASAPTSLFVE